MKVFLSWSGETSKEIAVKFKEWLPNVLQYTKPFVSAEDIDSGTRWSQNIARELEETYYGIIFVTKDNVAAPWINFEAGALSKQFDTSHVTPVLYNIKPEEISGPLVQFQMITNSREGIWNLIKSLNKSAEDLSLNESRLQKIFDVWWPHLESELGKIKETKSRRDHSEDTASKASISLNSSEEQIAEILNLLRSQQKQYNPSSIQNDKNVNKSTKVSSRYALVELKESLNYLRQLSAELEEIKLNEDKVINIDLLYNNVKKALYSTEKAILNLGNLNRI